MKKVMASFIILLSSIFVFGTYQYYQQKQVEKYWLKMANKAAINNDTKFINFYNQQVYNLHTLSISEGWKLYERYYKKY